MTFARSWITRAVVTTTLRSEWEAYGNGIRFPRGGSIRTRWPTPSPALLNQLFGKGKEPFWQQAYTNLVRWIIELHRVLPEQWVTLQQVYQCAIDPDLFRSQNQTGREVERRAKHRGGFHSASRAWAKRSGGHWRVAMGDCVGRKQVRKCGPNGPRN